MEEPSLIDKKLQYWNVHKGPNVPTDVNNPKPFFERPERIFYHNKHNQSSDNAEARL